MIDRAVPERIISEKNSCWAKKNRGCPNLAEIGIK